MGGHGITLGNMSVSLEPDSNKSTVKSNLWDDWQKLDLAWVLVDIKELLILLSMIMLLYNVFEKFSSARNIYLSINERVISCLGFALKYSGGKVKVERKDELRTGKLMVVGTGWWMETHCSSLCVLINFHTKRYLKKNGQVAKEHVYEWVKTKHINECVYTNI